MIATMVFAHGVGSRGDLPLPLWQFVWAAVFAIVVSFVALGVLWTTPRLASAANGVGLARVGAALRVLAPVARLASLGLFFLVVATGLFGNQATNANLTPVAVYVVLWVVLQLVVPVMGDVWQVLSPFDTIIAVLDRVRSTQTAAVAPSWSHWLAPAGAAGFIFMELIHPEGDSPRNLAVAMALYSGIVLGGAVRWGRPWLRDAEFFAVHFRLLGAMAPLSRRPSGGLTARMPLSGLASMTIPPVGVAVLLVVLGGVSFDGFGESELWRDLVGQHGGWENAAWRLGGLVTVTAVVSALYLLSVRSMARTTRLGEHELANMFAPSLVPIVFGYTVAHYLQLAIDETQTFVFQLSDPFGRGWDLFGGAGGTINYTIVSVDAIAWCQAIAVVVGHIAGVVVAHDRAVGLFASRDAVRSQYVMLFVMVLYSVFGLWLLLNA